MRRSLCLTWAESVNSLLRSIKLSGSSKQTLQDVKYDMSPFRIYVFVAALLHALAFGSPKRLNRTLSRSR